MFDNNGEVQCHCRNSKSTSSMVHGNAAMHICEEQSAACVLMLWYEIFHFAFWPNQPRRCGQYIYINTHLVGLVFFKNQVWKFMTCHTCIYICIYIYIYIILSVSLYIYIRMYRYRETLYLSINLSIYLSIYSQNCLSMYTYTRFLYMPLCMSLLRVACSVYSSI